MKVSQFKDYSELPLFLNAELVAKVLGVSHSSGYELMHKSGFPILRACLKSSNEDGNKGKNENLSRNKEFALTIFPKSAEFVEPAEKTLYHPAARQHNKLV